MNKFRYKQTHSDSVGIVHEIIRKIVRIYCEGGIGKSKQAHSYSVLIVHEKEIF